MNNVRNNVSDLELLFELWCDDGRGFYFADPYTQDSVNSQIFVQWVERIKRLGSPLRQHVFFFVSFTMSLWSNQTSFWFQDRCVFVPWAFSHRTDLQIYHHTVCIHVQRECEIMNRSLSEAPPFPVRGHDWLKKKEITIWSQFSSQRVSGPQFGDPL